MTGAIQRICCQSRVLFPPPPTALSLFQIKRARANTTCAVLSRRARDESKAPAGRTTRGTIKQRANRRAYLRSVSWVAITSARRSTLSSRIRKARRNAQVCELLRRVSHERGTGGQKRSNGGRRKSKPLKYSKDEIDYGNSVYFRPERP